MSKQLTRFPHPFVTLVALTFVILAIGHLTVVPAQTAPSAEVRFGSITGRVVNEDAAGTGVGGVKVLVRRVHAGPGNFHFERISAADGTFDLKYLLPGRYTVEVLRQSIPDRLDPALAPLRIVDIAADRSETVRLTLTRGSLASRKL